MKIFTCLEVEKKLESEVSTIMVHRQANWQSWDLQSVVALKRWMDSNTVENAPDNLDQLPSKRPGTRKQKRRVCAYCDNTNHILKNYTKIVMLTERKERKRSRLHLEANIEQRAANVTLPAKCVERNIHLHQTKSIPHDRNRKTRTYSQL